MITNNGTWNGWGDFANRVTFKMLSGRFIFTMAIIIVFMALSLKAILPLDYIKEIILVGLYAYFTRSDRTNANGDTTTTTTLKP